jgi:ParB family chromosome partitioning protein
MTALTAPRRVYRELEIDKIELTELDLRTTVDEAGLEELSTTVGDLGILQPILVSLDSKRNKYQLIIGGRRFRAAQGQGLKTIPAAIVDDLQESQALVMMLIENMQRKDLEPLEEANGMAELRDRFRYSDSRIAKLIGKTTSFVEDRLALLRLPDKLKAKIKQSRLGVSQAICLTRLEGREATQIAIAEEAEEKGLAADIVDRMIDEVARPKRRYRKMTRKHKLKRTGKLLSESLMKKKLQQIVLRGEQLLELLDGLALSRWTPNEALKLHGAITAIEQGLQRFKHRTLKRSREK